MYRVVVVQVSTSFPSSEHTVAERAFQKEIQNRFNRKNSFTFLWVFIFCDYKSTAR